MLFFKYSLIEIIFVLLFNCLIHEHSFLTTRTVKYCVTTIVHIQLSNQCSKFSAIQQTVNGKTKKPRNIELIETEPCDTALKFIFVWLNTLVAGQRLFTYFYAGSKRNIAYIQCRYLIKFKG